MTERLLQYIWQFLHFNKNSLQTTDGHSLQVISAGTYNTNQGPDFLNGKIRIDKTLWAGSIELHIKTSDWHTHDHSNDTNYNNVILHVVWNNNTDLALPFPTLELQFITSSILLKNYETLLQSTKFIPCEKQLNKVSELIIIKWKERMLIERLQKKALYIEQLLKQNNYHWEETFWWMLARNFGAKINSEAFEKISQSIPINILAKHKSQILQLEALLFGQAGILDGRFKDAYQVMLQKEYLFMKRKYGLKKIYVPLYFLRMRPANFPTVRLAQLAALIHQSLHLFSQIKDITDFRELKDLFQVTANDYWHYHYLFDELTIFKKKTLGRQMVQNILINTVVPILYAYGYFNNNEFFKAKAIDWIGRVEAEKNNVTRPFELLGMKNNTAFDSQALLQLKQEYCDQRRCLECAIGNALIKNEIVCA